VLTRTRKDHCRFKELADRKKESTHTCILLLACILLLTCRFKELADKKKEITSADLEALFSSDQAC
jgi:hypothetical protein